MTAEEAYYRAAERRMELWAIALGVVASVILFFTRGWPYAAGVLAGASLGWVNFRWLKQAMNVMSRLAQAQTDAPAVRVPKGTYVKFIARYALIIAVLYVIFSNSLLPAAPVIGGFFAPVGAVVVETLYQMLSGGRDSSAKSR